MKSHILKFYAFVIAASIFCFTLLLSHPLLQFTTSSDLSNSRVFPTFQDYDSNVEIPQWGLNTSRNISDYVNLSLSRAPEDFCSHDTLLVIIVFSHPNNVKARSAIRETWAQKEILTSNNISLYFLMGHSPSQNEKQLSEEQVKFQDLIQEDFIESYYNLSIKSVMMLKMFRTPTKCRFLMKCDDDIYANLPLLSQKISTMNASEDLLIGRLIKKEKRIWDNNVKWYAPQYMYKGKIYPNFLSGTAYMMSTHVGKKLFEAAKIVPIFHLEDVYVTGICAKKAGITPVHNIKFTDYKLPTNFCNFFKLFTLHSFNHVKMRIVYQKGLHWRYICSNRIKH